MVEGWFCSIPRVRNRIRMAIVTDNPITGYFRGRIGDIVYKRYGDKLVASRIPRFKSTKPTAGQKPRRELFQAASAYAVIVRTKSGLHAEYIAEGILRKRTPRSLAIRDFMRAAAMGAVDVSGINAVPAVV